MVILPPGTAAFADAEEQLIEELRRMALTLRGLSEQVWRDQEAGSRCRQETLGTFIKPEACSATGVAGQEHFGEYAIAGAVLQYSTLLALGHCFPGVVDMALRKPLLLRYGRNSCSFSLVVPSPFSSRTLLSSRMGQPPWGIRRFLKKRWVMGMVN